MFILFLFSHIEKEFQELARLQQTKQSDAVQHASSFDFLFQDLQEVTRQSTPLQLWTQEINFYQNMPRPDGRTNPLLWWKCNANQLPNLCMNF